MFADWDLITNGEWIAMIGASLKEKEDCWKSLGVVTASIVVNGSASRLRMKGIHLSACLLLCCPLDKGMPVSCM